MCSDLSSLRSYSAHYFTIRNSVAASRAFSNFLQPVRESRKKQALRNSSSTMIQNSFALGKHEAFGSVGTNWSILSSTENICFVGRKLNIIF